MNGVLVVDKPAGLSSHDVVVRVRRAVGLKRIGHTGTLDPIATGVLPLVLGRATRLAPFLSATTKTYDATIRLGLSTDTYDMTGHVLDRQRPESDSGWHLGGERTGQPAEEGEHRLPSTQGAVGRPTDSQTLEAVREAFTGTFWQRPPPFSAKKIGGVRAYALARRQTPVEAKPVSVTVHALEVLSLQSDQLRVRLTCSPGFYVRSLAHDLGVRLGCGACVETLRRERSGAFALDAAVPLAVVEEEGIAALQRVTPLPDLLPDIPGVVLTDRGAQRAAHGNTISPEDVTSRRPPPGRIQPDRRDRRVPAQVKLFDCQGSLVALAETGPGSVLHPTIVLV